MILSAIIGANILLLGFFAFTILRKKHILNFLIGLSLIALLALEIGKLSLVFNFEFHSKILGLGFFLTILFWLVASTSFLPPKSFSFNKTILSPIFGVLSLAFFFAWWIKPFITIGSLEAPTQLSKLAQYFFVLVVFDLTLVLSNLERAFSFLKQKNVKNLLVGSLFLLGPYIFVSTYAVLFSVISTKFLVYSSLSILVGSIILIVSSREGFGVAQAKEGSTAQASMILFLIGGYLFVIGAVIKLFKAFGWNLNTLFAFLTTIFVFFVTAFLIFSSSLKDRIKAFLLRHFSRQRYDWQKIWEEFTYKVSLVADIEKVKSNITEVISKIMGLKDIQIHVFEKELPFEKEFSDWLLRRAEAFEVDEVFDEVFSKKYPKASSFFKNESIKMVSPLYGDRKIIGFIGFNLKQDRFLDKELLKVLSLQSSGAVLNCWANQALREAERKESIYKVSSFVIHDVKNYINNLSLLVNNKDKFNNFKFQQDALYTLDNTIQKMQRLVDEFRALRGDLVLKRNKHKLADLVDEVLKGITKDRLSGIKIIKNIDESIEIDVDAYYFERVIINLVLNALEAMAGGGELRIEASHKVTRSQGHMSQENIEIVVEDTGVGMSKDFIEKKLFKPFSSTKEKGMGIGLYQCKTIIEAHGGVIEVESKEGAGAAFRVRLPAVPRSQVTRLHVKKGE